MHGFQNVPQKITTQSKEMKEKAKENKILYPQKINENAWLYPIVGEPKKHTFVKKKQTGEVHGIPIFEEKVEKMLFNQKYSYQQRVDMQINEYQNAFDGNVSVVNVANIFEETLIYFIQEGYTFKYLGELGENQNVYQVNTDTKI